MRKSLCRLVFILFCMTQASFADELVQSEVVVPLERITVAIPLELEDWQLAWQEADIGTHVLEWVTGEESVDKWTRLFTVLRLVVAPNVTADKFAVSYLDSLRHSCPGLKSSILNRDADDILLEWQVSGCKRADDQHELTRLIRAEDYLFQINYAQKGPTMSADIQEHWLDVLRQVHLVHGSDTDDQGLSAIPLLQLRASYKFNEVPGMRLTLEVPKNQKSKGSVVYTSSGFPSDHIWEVYIIRVPTAEAIPFATMVANERGVLQCPGPEHAAAAKNKGTWCGKPGFESVEQWNISVSGFQKGLAIAFAARSTDGAHATYVKAIPVPIVGQSGTCRVELELVSTDARTFVAYGSGFPPDEAVNLSWTYAQNTGSNIARSGSAGTFMAAVNHGGPPQGMRKWHARLQATASSCKVDVKYKWGAGGMRP